MQEFLDTALSMPTLAFTTMLGIVVLYWATVVVGALDIDTLDPGGALDGVDGALDGIDGMADGADVDMDIDPGADSEVSSGGLAGLLHALRLRYAPLTVVFSFIALFGWLGTFFGTRYVEPLLPLGGFVSGMLIAVIALVLAMPLTSLLTRPLAPLFRTEKAKKNKDLIGSVVTIKTGKVDAGFGQATLDDGQAGFLLTVRCDTSDALTRGDRALIVGWDESSNTFDVEPMEAVLGAEAEAKKRGGS